MATHPHSPDQTLININSHDSEALDRNGVALVALNKHNEALKAFDKALEINPQDSIALKGKSALSNIGSKFDTMTELTSLTNKSTFGQLITFTAKIGTPSQGIKKPSGIAVSYTHLSPTFTIKSVLSSTSLPLQKLHLPGIIFDLS